MLEPCLPSYQPFKNWNDEGQSFSRTSYGFYNDVPVLHEKRYGRSLHGRHLCVPHRLYDIQAFMYQYVSTQVHVEELTPIQ